MFHDDTRDLVVNRILVIDDDNQTRRMLRLALERAGYEVIEARNGREGVQCYQATPTDLIITDVLMPGMEGIEAIVELQRERTDVKIIAISGGGYMGTLTFLEIAEQAGACRTFEKPFTLRELLAAVHEVLEEGG
jgi:DNA-binding NtrC family response regulator